MNFLFSEKALGELITNLYLKYNIECPIAELQALVRLARASQ